MRDLTPNSPASRFEHVLKTYWGKSYAKEPLAGVVYDTFYVTTSLLGSHDSHWSPQFADHQTGSLRTWFRTIDEREIERVQKALDTDEPALGMYTAQKLKVAKDATVMLARLGQPYVYTERGEISWGAEQWALAELVLQVVKLPQHSPADFLIPWVARELMKLAKAAHDEEVIHTVVAAAYSDAVDVLYDKSPAIAQWVKESRTDIGKVSLTQALEAIAIYKFKQSLVEQGAVVYKYKDGWTVQELRTERALLQEGKQMQNCVGGYHDVVENGGVRIYSVRDTGGHPHATLELVAPAGSTTHGPELDPEKFIRSEKRLIWHFEQILGKQNYAPNDEYRDRARVFIDRMFDKEGFGWCMTGGTPKWARFANRKLDRLDFVSILGTNHLEDDTFAGADFTGASLTTCVFRALVLDGTIFDKADLTEANFQRANLTGARFEGATCHFVYFADANCTSASFDSAHLGSSAFIGADVKDASFRHAAVDGAVLGNLKNATKADWSDVNMSALQRTNLFGTKK